MRFVDTNVLVYAVSPAPEEADKRRAAQRIIVAGDLALSVQVLQEFYHQVTRRTRQDPLSGQQALSFLASIDAFPIAPITAALFHSAVDISLRYRLSYWDAAILAAANSMGCDAVYSEDLNDQQDYGGLRVINPFARPAATA